MSVFSDILMLLTAPPGGLVYYLVVLFSIWSAVGLALARWSRGERRGIVARLLVASAIMSCARLVFFVLALLDRGSAQSTGFLLMVGPPLERFIDTLSAILMIWAVAIPAQKRTLGRILVGVASFIAIAVLLLTVMQWATTYQTNPDTLYNRTWQPWLWELGQIALLAGAAVYLLIVSVPERGTILVMLGVLGLGHLLQLIWPFADQIPDYAAWVRFANLLAFPLFAVVAFRLIAQRFDAQAASLQAVNQESLSQITGLMDLLDINRKMSDSLELDTVLENAIRSISQTLQSDLCALVLLPSESAKEGELAIRYNAPDIVHDKQTFDLDDYPAIQHAIARKKAVILQANENQAPQQVYQLLGKEANGPLIAQPLEYRDHVIGAILVCQPGRASFTPVHARKGESIATHVTLAVLNARQYQDMRTRIDQQAGDLQSLEQGFARTKADLENRLQKSQEEIAVYVQKLYEAELAEQRAQSDARDLRQQLNGRAHLDPETFAQLQQQVEAKDTEVALLQKKVATLGTTRSQLEQQVKDLDAERKQLRSHLSQAETSFKTLRSRAQQLQATLSQGGSQSGNLMDRAALDSLPYGVLVCDTQGLTLHLNGIAEEQLGYKNAPWDGKSILDLWPDEEWVNAVHAVTDQYTTQTPMLEPFVVQRPDRQIQIALSSLRTKDQHVGALLSIQDTRFSNEQTRARDEFLSSLAQDLRTPMTSILGYTELLMSESVGGLEGMQRKFLQRVQANIERMGAMLNDLIGVTAIDSGKLEIELEPVDVTRVVESALRKAQFRLEERELATQVNMAEIPAIYADPEHIQQMVDNLLTNACTSSAAGTTIHILAHQETDETGQDHLHVAVSDTGGGISDEDRARVFERFYRADNALIAGLGETGVGLAIVKALVEAHQGHVWLDTKAGEGTTFHVTLPYGLERTLNASQGERQPTPQPPAGDNGHG